MLRKLNSTAKSGFTLVEIMIVVAIIALLAAIAVPNFMRARKRSQATSVLEELRLIDAAKDQYAIENNQKGNIAPTFVEIQPYLKASSALVQRNIDSTATTFKDVMNSDVTIGAIDTPPAVPTATFNEFSEVAPADFWGAYQPGGTTAPAVPAAPGA